MKKLQIVSITLAALLLAGCGAAESADPASESASEAASTVETAPAAESESEAPAAEAALPDGVYTADFNTDSSMFHANESCDGKGTLTVADGRMTMHVSLQSKKIVNLYLGMAADAADHEADWLQPTTDTVTYSDGTSEEVYGFDIPVAAVDADFQLAILGTKGTWYDHTVSVANAELAAEVAGTAAEAPADGTYTCAVTLEGGSGRATVESPAALTVADGALTATIVWSSPNYDYMLIDGKKYLPINTEGNSTFVIPVAALDTALPVTADTVAMSTPHEIDYTLTFDSATLAAAE
ncbi:iron transporter [uncultured Gemmiger sp.]|uniref:iron transporter n=1 Tax=uncultured Gemmiger sp. TaxID=1623490 RepID=UPI0025F9901D|nr:iron transporter [uncultured Gemmiger sp.]